MRRRLLPVLAGVVLLATACSKRPTPTVDVLKENLRGWHAFAITECVANDPDGVSCDKKTCTPDEVSDCAAFANACINSGHYYSGSSAGGTCSRIL